MMTAASGPPMMISHPIQPFEGAPLLREGPRQLVLVELPVLGQSGRKGETEVKAESAEQPGASQLPKKVNSAQPTQPAV